MLRWRWREVSTAAFPDMSRQDGPDAVDRMTLHEDLRRLSPRQRAVLVLRCFDDPSEAEIAAALGISVGTVKSHRRDALPHLRDRQLPEQRSTARPEATPRARSHQPARPTR